MSTIFEPGAVAPDFSIPLCVPNLRGNEWKYIQECLETNYVSSVGPFVERFEHSLAEYVGTKYAVATVNGTAALHIALLVAGVRPDDEVLVSTLSFIAPANAVRYTGAWPVLIDAEPSYWQMDSNKVAEYLNDQCLWVNGELRSKVTGRRVSAILPVHILGHPVDMDAIVDVALKYKLSVIEDATESLGSRYKERMVGRLGDIACFSFNGNKIITTGGGGMIVTDNEEWAHRAKYLTTQAKDDPVEFVHREIGYNYRLTNLQAAVGCAQMEVLDEYIAIKRRAAKRYVRHFEDISGITFMDEAQWAFSTFWLSTALVNESDYGIGSRRLIRELADRKIQARPLWRPLHASVAHRGCLFGTGEVAEGLNRDAVSLPCSVGIRDNQVDFVAQTIQQLKDLR